MIQYLYWDCKDTDYYRNNAYFSIFLLLFSLFSANFAPSPTIQNKMRKVLLLNMCFICSLFCYGQMTLSSCGLNDTKWRNDHLLPYKVDARNLDALEEIIKRILL